MADNTTGNSNSAFGTDALRSGTRLINCSGFGNGAAASSTTAQNEITLGNGSIATLRCQVTTITALSDVRDKADVTNIPIGLDFIKKLRPVTFKWDKREWYESGIPDGTKKDSATQVGFIAQELKQLQEETNTQYLKLVYESNPEKLEATPGNLLVPLIKAVQELSVKVKTLEEEIMLLKQ
jgi:hypothetical protein